MFAWGMWISMKLTRTEAAAECKRLAEAIKKTKSEKLKNDYSKRLRKLQKRLLYCAD